MFGNHFYWASARKVNAIFGNLFNDIRIQRVDADDNVIKTFTVPIEQAQKQGYLVRLNETAKKELEHGIAITLPRLSYEMVGLQYKADDRLAMSRYIRSPKSDEDGTAHKMFNPVPYTMSMDLSLYTKTIDEALQIVEQIVPYFGPHLGLTINEIPEMGLTNDIKIQLDGFDTNVDYEGHIGDGRLIVWTFNFSIDMKFFHPTSDATVIKKVIENIYASHTDSPENPDSRPDMIITQVVNPITADENGVFTIDYLKQEPELPGSIFGTDFTPEFD